MAKDTFYITTPIYYVNDVPHVGHAYTTVAADFIARYHRLAGEKVFFLTGTDEHGQKIAQAAEERGLDPQTWSDQMIPRWVDVWDRLEISYDDFIRTTEERHIKPVQALVQELYDRGDIYLDTYEGHYCVACEAFYQPSELIDGLCPIHERPVQVVKEENYFFRLSSYAERLLDLYESRPSFVRPEVRRNEVMSFVKGGLQDLSISRTSFTWGVPIPWDPKHVMYVWIDALQNYITAAGQGSDPGRFERIWPADIHLIGKDILRQHAVIWPALLMAAGLEIPKTVFAHGYLTVGGKKMSKTNLTGISPHQLIDTIGPDGYRYHFLREGSFGQDGSFSWEAMVARYNADLANDLGNLVSRTLAMTANYFDAVVPAPEALEDEETNLQSAAAKAARDMDQRVRDLDPGEALAAVFELVKATNHYIDACTPWKLAKDPDQRGRLATVLHSACEAIRQISILISPAMPAASRRIRDQLGLDQVDTRALAESLIPGESLVGTKITKGASIFPRVEAEP
ncbi:MAG TPA: methionine--tRNA ligase [Actinomycetota bacterium]|nr:methionine--tRNA ligase [Actinomycetota bacterium]